MSQKRNDITKETKETKVFWSLKFHPLPEFFSGCPMGWVKLRRQTFIVYDIAESKYFCKLYFFCLIYNHPIIYQIRKIYHLSFKIQICQLHQSLGLGAGLGLALGLSLIRQGLWPCLSLALGLSLIGIRSTYGKLKSRFRPMALTCQYQTTCLQDQAR